MKATILLTVLLLGCGLNGMDRQDPSKQSWDGKFFYKATKQSLPMAKQMLDEFNWSDYQKIVDVGCGPGTLTAHIAKRAPHAQVMGIDPSESMIRFAQGYYHKQKNLTFVQASLPLEFDNIDFIFSCNAFHLLPREEQIGALKRFAAHVRDDKNVSLFIIMAAKTKVPQAFTKAYAATMEMKRWKKLRAINLDDYFQPHDEQSIRQLVQGTGFEVKETEIKDEHIQFKNAKRLKRFITSWMGGFEFVAQLQQKKQKRLIKDLIAHYLEEVPLAADGSIEWRSPRLVVHAEKPKEA